MKSSALRAIATPVAQHAQGEVSARRAAQDIDAILASFRLHEVRRYFQQQHWLEESAAATAADEAEPGLKLENVAAHSWHVADAVLVLAPQFDDLNPGRAAMLAILHDKLEMITGDFDPVGPDGRGTRSHAFDPGAAARKQLAEDQAQRIYLNSLPPPARRLQEDLLRELRNASTSESLFVKAVDKLQALAYVYRKKNGEMSLEHLAFSMRYSYKCLVYFPRLSIHYYLLLQRLIALVAERRGASPDDLLNVIVDSFGSYLIGT